MLSLSEIFTISTLLQGMIYGFAVFMFGITMFLLTRDPFRRRASRGMIAVSCTLILLATIEFITNVVRLVRGHITVGPKFDGGPNLFFATPGEPTYLIKGCLYPFQVLILDAAVIYRAYIAWGCSYYAIAVPCLGWCGLLASTVGIIHAMFVMARHPSSLSAVNTMSNWILASYTITLATNCIATGLLAYRIWRVNRRSSALGASTRLGLVLRVVIESGAIYVALNLIVVVANRVSSPAVYFVRDLLPPVVPIVFNMIVVRVRFATSRKLSVLGIESTFEMPTPPKVTTPSGSWQLSPHPTRQDSGLGLRSLALELTQFLETNLDATSTGETDAKVVQVGELIPAHVSRVTLDGAVRSRP